MLSIYDTALTDAEITKLSNNQAGRYEYHHTNALGSNIVLTDDNKNVLVRYEYDVFGAVRSETGTSDNPRKFTGKEYESDVKLYYFAARYYDPYIGRFTQRDPIGDGINWYAYAFNNPLSFIDPLGLRAFSPLESSAIESVFGSGIDTAGLEIEFADLEDRGEYDGVKITIALALRNAAGVNADSTVDNTDILSPAVIDYLSSVVHEAVHHWQRQHRLHLAVSPTRGMAPNGERYYNVDTFELSHLLLGREQHASAVQVYFIANWQISHGAEQITFDGIYPATRFRYYTGENEQIFTGVMAVSTVSQYLHYFSPVINELQNPIMITTWGNIK